MYCYGILTAPPAISQRRIEPRQRYADTLYTDKDFLPTRVESPIPLDSDFAQVIDVRS